MSRKTPFCLSIAAVLLTTGHVDATEICGNSTDDDSNGLTDEGCYPTLTTGVCESPLSCGETGMVSWTTGSLHYDLPPDIAPEVPYGPGIGLRRFYTSMYTPGTNPTSVNHTPLGPNWQHTYMTWLYDFVDSGSVNRIVLHTSAGKDIYYTFSNTVGSVDYFSPQAGEHVLSLKRDNVVRQYYVQLLTGETLVYNAIGQIIEIWDNLAPTSNKVLIQWTGTSNANVSTVTDASGERRLSFTYSNNLLTSVTFQTLSGTSWTNQHVTNYDYSNGVTRDATSLWFVPQSSSEWTNLLAGTGIPNPTNLWKLQEASGNLADSIGSASLTATNNGGMAYSQTVSGWSRKAVTLNDNTTSKWASGSTLCNPASTACTAFAIAQVRSLPAGMRDMFAMGDSNGARAFTNKGGPLLNRTIAGEFWNGSSTSLGFLNNNVHAWVMSANPSSSFTQLTADSAAATPTWATGTSANGTFTLGAVGSNTAASAYLYAAAWNNAGLSAAQQSALVRRIQNGPGLSTVTQGATLTEKYVYDGNGYLTQIKDGGDLQVAAFSYSTTNLGEIDRIATSRGSVGFEYNSTRAACTGKTLLYFNQGVSSSCSVDSDCGGGYLCGGKTSTGSTGQCFLAGRCLTTGTVNGESVVTDVAAVGAGGTCSGTCTDVMHYAWTGSGTGNVNVTGTADPLSNYTSVQYNSNGLPTQIGYGDTDADPTNGGTNRKVFYIYDTTYPGRVVEIRRPSDLDPNASSCSSASTTGCQRTLYCYGNSCSASCANDNQLCTVEQTGKTIDASGSIVSFSAKFTYVHDAKGRISEIDGAVGNVKTLFNFFAVGGTANGLKDNFISDTKTYKDSSNYLQTYVLDYDFWGHPTALQGPDDNLTCDDYDRNTDFQLSRRRAMAGQTNCASTDPADLTTFWDRDSHLRLTSVKRPDGGCVLYSYNSDGRIDQIKRRDDCSKISTGDTQQFIYSQDGQVREIDTYDASNTLTAKKAYSYYASRRLQEVMNPANTLKFKGMTYDAAGRLTEIDGEDSLSKTVFHFSGAPGREGRVTSIDKYNTSSTSDTWDLLYAFDGGQSQVTDGNSKVTGSVRDDLGRLVKLTSPDLGGPSLRIYDAQGRVTTLIEDLGGGSSQQTHTFAYDAIGRTLVEDFHGSCATTGTAHPEVQRSYDALPTGVTCPITGGCNNLAGRLAYVQTVLMCSSAYGSTDGSLDQFTFYSYDRAGRLLEEYITDDTARIADHKFEYTKDGSLSKVTTPSGAIIGWTYDSMASNSDADRVTAVWFTSPSSPVADSFQWFPFGPWKQYNWQASIGGTQLRNRVTRDLAYRATTVYGAETVGGASVGSKVTLTQDPMGRVTSRQYLPHDPSLAGLFDSYYLYDQQSRVVCETTDSQSACPTTGSNLKNNHSLSPPFMAAGDWKQVLRPIPGSTGLTNNFNTSGTAYGTTHQVTDINQSDGSPAFGHTAIAYDARGLRSYDDNTGTLTNDRRDYTYDGRQHVVNVRGQYYTGSAWHYYDVGSAYDQRGRRVFKSFYDETTLKTAQWFFYYDPVDRLIEVRYTPDSSVSGTYSLMQVAWMREKLLFYWQSDYVGGSLSATSKRYVASDEKDRPLQLWNWPSSGDATRVWAVNPTAWANDVNIIGPSLYQPIVFAGQYQDSETVAYENDGITPHRPAISVNGLRTYDPFTGSYLQVDLEVEKTWSSYGYVNSDPVGSIDPMGLDICGECNNGDGDGGGGIPQQSCNQACAIACVSCDLGELIGCDCDACGCGKEGVPHQHLCDLACAAGESPFVLNQIQCGVCPAPSPPEPADPTPTPIPPTINNPNLLCLLAAGGASVVEFAGAYYRCERRKRNPDDKVWLEEHGSDVKCTLTNGGAATIASSLLILVPCDLLDGPNRSCPSGYSKSDHDPVCLQWPGATCCVPKGFKQ